MVSEDGVLTSPWEKHDKIFILGKASDWVKLSYKPPPPLCEINSRACKPFWEDHPWPALPKKRVPMMEETKCRDLLRNEEGPSASRNHSSIHSLFWLLECTGRWHAKWNEDANTLSMKFFQSKGQCKLFTDSEEPEQIISGRKKEENKNVLNATVHNFTEKAMATHSSTLAWQISWTEEPGRLQSTGSLGVRHDWATSLSLYTFMHWRRQWQTTPMFLPGESQGRGCLVGCRLWGSTELDTTEAT